MELRNRITTLGIGATVRLEGVAEGQASKWCVGMDAVLMPLTQPDHKG